MEMKPKKELVRIVKNKTGEISLDPDGRKPGRGAYICLSGECAANAKKKKALARVFSCKVEDEMYESIVREINDRSSIDAKHEG